jgi:hypothetical protein
VRYWLLVALAGLASACRTPEVCAIEYRDCCLVETEKELKLKGDYCWPKGTFIFRAGDIQNLIDEGKATQPKPVKVKALAIPVPVSDEGLNRGKVDE